MYKMYIGGSYVGDVKNLTVTPDNSPGRLNQSQLKDPREISRFPGTGDQCPTCGTFPKWDKIMGVLVCRNCGSADK